MVHRSTLLESMPITPFLPQNKLLFRPKLSTKAFVETFTGRAAYELHMSCVCWDKAWWRRKPGGRGPTSILSQAGDPGEAGEEVKTHKRNKYIVISGYRRLSHINF